MKSFLVINIANLPIKISCSNNIFLRKIQSHYKGFIDTRKKSRTVFELKIEITNMPYKNLVCYRILKNTQRKSNLSICFEDKINLTIDKYKNMAFLKTKKNFYYIDSALAIIHNYVLIKKNGIRIHAAALIRNQKGYLFFGPSGSGKTTVSHSVEGIVLHDDAALIRQVGKKFRIYNSPSKSRFIKNAHTKNESAELKGVFRLIKSINNKLKRTNHMTALKYLKEQQRGFAPCFGSNVLNNKISKTLYNLVNNVNTYNLYFRKKCDFWGLIDEIE
jgi:hypothetical protein